MLYRNVKTGAIVNVDSELGGLWLPVDAKKPEKATPAPTVPTAESVEEIKKTPVRKRTTKKTKEVTR
jgi:hypothetical protein